VNASPATVSRAGIIYASDADLDWAPVIEAWVRKRPDAKRQDILRGMITKWIGKCKPTEPGECFEFLARNCAKVMKEGRVGRITSSSRFLRASPRVMMQLRLLVVMAVTSRVSLYTVCAGASALYSRLTIDSSLMNGSALAIQAEQQCPR